jgi:hypothetical protein
LTVNAKVARVLGSIQAASEAAESERRQMNLKKNKVGFLFNFFMYFIQRCFICRPSGSTVPEDAGIEPSAE